MLHFTLSDYINSQLHTPTHIYMLFLRRNKIDIYMNKVKSLFCICIAAIGMQGINAQTRAEVEIRENPKLATGKYMAYEAPICAMLYKYVCQTRLTLSDRNRQVRTGSDNNGGS